MMREELFSAGIQRLQAAALSGDLARIEEEKCNCIYQASNLVEAVINYIALEHCGFHFDFGSQVIPKGTVLYRIRSYKEETDYSNPSEWAPPPHRPLNRANHEGEKALYLNCMEEACLLETHISEGDRYVLGTYEVVDDIHVGGYLSVPDERSRLLSIGIALNAVLIAPSRDKRNKELFEFLDEYYGEVLPDDIQYDDIKNNFWLPFKLAVMNRREEYYKITNKLCDILKKKNPSGIKYSSCYLPLETIGIDSNCYNLVLYEEGIQKIKFVRYEIKTNSKKDFTSTNLAKIVLRERPINL